jgi:hypothetical protein
MLTDILSYALGVLSVVGFGVFKNRKKRHRTGDPFSEPWLWSTKHGNNGFKCPKCWYPRTTKQPTHCSCIEFPRDHFHFTCDDCKYTAIMRVADDK